MIRKTQILFFLMISINSLAGELPVRQVPANVEIAGMKLKITPEAQREIQKDIDALRASEKYFNIKLDRANLYFPLIEKVLKEEGVPDDIKYLSLQESALISDQVSSSDAVGYWQFKDFTAREMGMRVDSKVDERKNVVSSTYGAAKYMRKNNFMLKNWIYAVNAYMTGPGGVRPYIDEEGIGADKLTITHKTHWYVKRFIAHVIAFREDVGRPHSGGMQLVIYQQGANKHLHEIAKNMEVDEDLVHHYNKWLSYGKIPDDRIYPVILPVSGNRPKMPESVRPQVVERADPRPAYPGEIVEKINTMSKTIFLEINDRRTILATSEDDLRSLADKSGTPVEKLRKFNDMTQDRRVSSGQFYFTRSKRNSSGIRYHVAQFDESLWDISQRYGVKLKKLRKKNRMAVHEQVKPGRILWLKQKRPKDLPPEYRKVEIPVIKKEIPPKPSTVRPAITKPAEIKPATSEPPKTTVPLTAEAVRAEPEKSKIDVHEVVAGESLYGIARLYDITVEDLMDWNGLRKNDPINPGQKLMVTAPLEVSVRSDETLNSKPAAGERIHIVQPDETYYSISRKYGIEIEYILRRNKADLDTPIKPNQELIIPVDREANAGKVVSSSGKTYVVQAGDTFYRIAREFGLSVEDLMKLNEKEKPDLSIGEILRISN